MREYELTVVYDLAVAEAGGGDAPVQHLTTAVEARGGRVLRVDHWGRRRMAYPINRALDADYLVSRVEIEPAGVDPLEAALRIDERVYRHLIVRADELPPPPVPREPRRQPVEAAAPEAAADRPAAPVSAAEPAPAVPVEAAEAALGPATAEPAAAEPATTEPATTEPAEPRTAADTPAETGA
ncbi:MAG: 30S ribosomal protein S6 [Dehalococcoidia bacterium]|nr:30S ribosomal protein S6 [Dehalococcoidia bacterium]